jgi:hypothetical protein
LITTLQALRHVPGVLGSFLWMDEGRLVVADLVPPRPAATLELATRKLASIAAAYAASGECLEHITVAYDSYQLHISGVGNASLVTLLTRSCSLHALTPVIEAVLRELRRLPELGVHVPNDRAPLPAARAPELDPAARSYRGGRIIE